MTEDSRTVAGDDHRVATTDDRQAVADGGRRIVADLHAHTTVSDGSLELSEVPDVARDAGLSWVALTDHDRVHPDLDAPVVERDGVKIIRGIEFRVDAGFDRLDLLGFGVEHTAELDAEIERLQRNRVDRGRQIIELVEERLGVTLDVEPRPGLGRPHIARAIERSDAPYDYGDAFDELIGDTGPCFVPRAVTDIERGVDLLRKACPLVGLAHPFRYADVDAALDVARDLDAVERWYPYDDGVDADPGRIDRVADEAGLIRIGGTDAHERELGVAGLTAAEFGPVRELLPPPVAE